MTTAVGVLEYVLTACPPFTRKANSCVVAPLTACCYSDNFRRLAKLRGACIFDEVLLLITSSSNCKGFYTGYEIINE
jgi:hypothetical protein